MASEDRPSIGRATIAVITVIVLAISAISIWKGAELNKLLQEQGMLPLTYLAYSRTGAVTTPAEPKPKDSLNTMQRSGKDPDPFAAAVAATAAADDIEVQDGAGEEESMGNLNLKSDGEQVGNLKKDSDSVDEMDNATTGARLTEQKANDRVTQVQAFLGSLQGPIIVGGIGDSGTRGTVDVLESFKVAMGDWRVRNSARDSRLFMRHYPVVYGKHIKYAGPTAYYAKGISSAHSLLYNKQTLEAAMGKRGVTHWYSGIQWAVETIVAHVKHYRLFSPAYKQLAEEHKIGKFVWGFKHPRALTLLPYYKGALGTKMKVVHVIRDGRDIALGDNRMMMRSLCKRYFGEELAAKGYCQSGTENRNDLRFWAVLNMDIAKWAKANLPKDQYLLVRTEDLVNGKVECFKRVQRFLYEDTDERLMSPGELKSLADRYVTYNSSYNGNKHASYIRRKITAQLRDVPEARDAMEYFGYNSKPKMGTSKSCIELDAN